MHIFYNLQFVSLCGSARQGLKLFNFAILSFHFLIMRKATPAVKFGNTPYDDAIE